MDYKLGDLVYCISGPYHYDTILKIIDTNNYNKYLVTPIKLAPTESYKVDSWCKE